MIWLFFILIAAVITMEMWVMLEVAAVVGSIATVAWIAVSFILGILLIRLEGIFKLVDIHRQLMDEVVPTREVLDLFFILVGGVLLILPGFITDGLGLLLLVAPTRWVVRSAVVALISRFVHTPAAGPRRPASEEVFEITPDPPSRP